MLNSQKTIKASRRYPILNTYVNALSLDETVAEVKKVIAAGVPTQHVVVNASKVNLMEADPKLVEQALVDMREKLEREQRGIQLREVAGGWRLYTHPAYHDLVEKYVLSWDTRKLSQAALETLAIVAYCQPVTRNDVSAIRGVSSDSSLNSLLEKGYLREAGVTEAPSNATLYGTTKMFLERFGLRSIAELPDLESFAPDEATRNLISERLGFVKEQAFTYEVEEENDQEMLEALTGALGAVEKIDLESISFDEE